VEVVEVEVDVLVVVVAWWWRWWRLAWWWRWRWWWLGGGAAAARTQPRSSAQRGLLRYFSLSTQKSAVCASARARRRR